MKRLKQLVVSFCADESAVTAIEYALIAGLIAVVITIAVATLGLNLKGLFDSVAKCFPTGDC